MYITADCCQGACKLCFALPGRCRLRGTSSLMKRRHFFTSATVSLVGLRSCCDFLVCHSSTADSESRRGSLTKHLLQFRVLGLGFIQNGNVRVSVFPEIEEVLIFRVGFGSVDLHGISATETKVGERSKGLV